MASKKSSDTLPLELNPPPAYFATRNAIFEKRKAERDKWVSKQSREKIKITLSNGSSKTGKSWETTPASIAYDISQGLLERAVVARVDGELWDIERPLEKSCELEILDFEHPEGKKVFWHSSAHILGEAAERRYGCSLCIGPPIENGFYYEMALPSMATISTDDYKPLKHIVWKAIDEKQPFERLEISKEDLLEMFAYNKYKQHIVNSKVPDGTSTTVYKCGPLIDLCKGPHLPNTSRIKVFQITKNSASYFLGDAKNDSLQRIYGVSFPDKKALKEHKQMLEEAVKRDHRKVGQDQELFFFHQKSPGSAFFLPHGMIIFNALQSFIREEYWKRGYQEVNSPNMYNSSLWKQSGHWQHYKDDMFTFEVEKGQDLWALKPMNCPGHCLIFGHRERTYNELPMRIADFGILHRNEASGALSGLTRVRRFVQDDTHIFCMESQVEQEIKGLFDLLRAAYGLFGFSFRMRLSTMPENHLGDEATWQRAEAQLTNALNDFKAETGTPWEPNPGDGAFYGPKIDVTISDALKREFQCATIQLDFQLPQKFNLEYRTKEQTTARPHVNGKKPYGEQTDLKVTDVTIRKDVAKLNGVMLSEEQTNLKTVDSDANGDMNLDINNEQLTEPESVKKDKSSYLRDLTPGYARPVMVHRAIYGSFERFIAILCEHFGGKWPFWLSPRQILIIPVMAANKNYALELQSLFRAQMMHADVDISGNTLQKKIRTGQLHCYNFIFIVGVQERDSRSVNIRNRDDPSTHKLGELVPVEKAMEWLRRLKDERSLKNELK